MKQQASVEIARAIETVFDYTNNHVAEWSITVVENEVIEEKPGKVGSTLRCVTEHGGRRMEFQGVVTRHERPTTSVICMAGEQFDIDATYTFEDLGGRTRVTQESTVTPKGFSKVLFFLFGWMMRKASCRALQEELDNLKRLLEEQAE